MHVLNSDARPNLICEYAPLLSLEVLLLLHKLHTLRKMQQLRSNDMPLLTRVLDQPRVQLRKRHHNTRDVLAVLEPLLGHLLALGQLHLDHDELHVGVRHARVGRLRRADAQHLRHLVARLLAELAHRCRLGFLVRVDQPRWPLHRVRVQRRAVLDHQQGRGGPGGFL